MLGVVGGWWSPAVMLEAAPERWMTLGNSRYRLIRRLSGVERFVLARHRKPGGWDGQAGDRYVHELTCHGAYDGPAGDWQLMRCLTQMRTRRADPVLHVRGTFGFTHEQFSYGLVDAARVKFTAPASLRIYATAPDADEILVVGHSFDGSADVTWTAPAPTWRPT